MVCARIYTMKFAKQLLCRSAESILTNEGMGAGSQTAAGWCLRVLTMDIITFYFVLIKMHVHLLLKLLNTTLSILLFLNNCKRNECTSGTIVTLSVTERREVRVALVAR